MGKCVLHGGAHCRHLANTTEPSMCGGNAAFLSDYFDHLFFLRCRSVLVKWCPSLEVRGPGLSVNWLNRMEPCIIAVIQESMPEPT